MQPEYHQGVRTTLTLDDDVAAKVKALSGKTGESFKVVLNRVLRAGLASMRAARPKDRFRVRARPLGLRRGVQLDNVAELLEQIDGPAHS